MRPYYQEAGITIYHADCRDVLASLEPCGFDLIITDPPYSSGARRDAERQVRGASMLRALADAEWFSHDTMTTWGFSWFIRSTLTELRRHLTAGAHLYVFADWRQTPNLYGMLEATGYRVNQCLVWDKGHYGMGATWRNQHEHIVFGSVGVPRPMRDRGRGSVLRVRSVGAAARQYPTEKPVELFELILRATRPGRLCDLFLGSGPALVAAKNLGREAVGIDLEEAACELAADRLRQGVLCLEDIN